MSSSEKLTTTNLATLSTCSMSATLAPRVELNALLPWLSNATRVAVRLEAVMWTVNAIRVLSPVGTAVLANCDAMTLTELARDEIPICIGHGRPPSMAMGTPVALSMMATELAGATDMLLNTFLLSCPVLLIRSLTPCGVDESVRSVSASRVVPTPWT